MNIYLVENPAMSDRDIEEIKSVVIIASDDNHARSIFPDTSSTWILNRKTLIVTHLGEALPDKEIGVICINTIQRY